MKKTIDLGADFIQTPTSPYYHTVLTAYAAGLFRAGLSDAEIHAKRMWEGSKTVCGLPVTENYSMEGVIGICQKCVSGVPAALQEVPIDIRIGAGWGTMVNGKWVGPSTPKGDTRGFR